MENEKYIWPQPKRTGGALQVMTTSELVDKADQQRKMFFKNLRYWKHNATNKTLTHVKDGYEVDLERFSSQAEYLEWILHLHSKLWMTESAFVEFVTALQYLIDRKKLPAK